MSLILAVLLAAQPAKTLTVNRATTPPRIDGRIEDTWLQADSIDDFVQSWPDDGGTASERTVVRVLQDDGNLYVAFRCYAARHRPVAALYGLEEEVTFFLDPTDSRSSGYFFRVYGSGLYLDGMLLDDGNNWDWSWDCIWYAATKLHEDRLDVEIRIPFKSIRYKPGAAEWGVNFDRMIAATQERLVWQHMPEEEGGMRVSNAGRLSGINPQARGYYFELYPEGFVRYDQDAGDTVKTIRDVAERVRPRASLNLKWDVTPQTSLNATALPDFAQIEADPYSFNLSRYPTYLSERRPFFVEGSEFFRMAGSGNGHNSLNTFYSRRIGKAVGQEPVPILGGLKLTSRQGFSNLGAIGAYTDALKDAGGNVIEPRRAFGVLSGRTRIAEQTTGGLILSGTMADTGNYNFALGGDWNFSTGPHNAIIQAAVSDRSGKTGWGLNSDYSGLLNGNTAVEAGLEAISDSFDVTDIGFVPWAGRVQFRAAAGPRFRGRGELARLTVMPNVGFVREPGSDLLSYRGGISANANLRSNCYIFLGADAGQQAEADTQFPVNSLNLSVEKTHLKYNLSFGGYAARGYNYARGFVAYNASDWLFYTFYIAGHVAVVLGGTNNWELDPQNRVVGVTTVARPRVDVRLNSKISFNLYNEIVLRTPETRWDSTQFRSNRIGCLFSWNFLPKSWLYVAFNDFRVDLGEGLTLASRIGAVKLRYLFYI
jgi:hypothetical protein